MKRKTTKEILAGSFQELAQDKPVDKITIQDITDNCDYSPATFYRYFHDKYDLIAWDYVHKISAIMDKVGINEYQWKDTLKEGMDYFFKNKKYIQNLLKHTQGHGAFVYYMSQTNINQLSKCYLKLSGKKKLDEDTKIYIRIYCTGTVQTVCAWLMDEFESDSGHMALLFENALPKPLHKVLSQK